MLGKSNLCVTLLMLDRRFIKVLAMFTILYSHIRRMEVVFRNNTIEKYIKSNEQAECAEPESCLICGNNKDRHQSP